MGLHFRAWKKALADNGAKLDFTWELLVAHGGRSTEYFVELLNREHGEKLDARRVARDQDAILAEIHHTVEAVPEVFAFVKKLAEQNIPRAIASGGTREAVGRTLAYIGADHLFDVVVTVEDVIHGKPAPDMFLLAAKRLGVAPEKCLVLGDSVLDIEGAKAAGMAWVKLEPQ
jgi:HAD superfamily hydrolase (TIGR01509 family)